MNNNRIILNPLVLIGIIITTSCTKGFIPEEEISNNTLTNDTVRYTTHIESIVSTNCLNCHSGNNPQGNLLLENYNQIRNSTENGTLLQRINDVSNPMPTSGLMPEDTRAIFDKWVQNGYLE